MIDLDTIGNICSILSLLISLSVLGFVIKINKSTTVKGSSNIVAGRDARIEKT